MPYRNINGVVAREQMARRQQAIHIFNLLIYHASHMLELVLAGLLTLALIVAMLRLFPELLLLFDPQESLSAGFNEFLEELFTLVVGVEALKMLCKHTPGSALEVLLFSMARSVVVYHTDLKFITVGILSVAVIFAVRRFLYVHDFDTEPEEGSIFAEISPDEPLFNRRSEMAPHTHQPHIDENGRPVSVLDSSDSDSRRIQLSEPEGRKTQYPPCSEQPEMPE